MSTNAELDPTEAFLLSVPSNTPNPSGAPNKPQQFTISTQHTAQLKGKWEVALVEIQYPNNWFNVKEDFHFIVTYGGSEEDRKKEVNNVESPTSPDAKSTPSTAGSKGVRTFRPTDSIQVPAGYYNSIQDLADKINSQTRLLKVAKTSDGKFIEIGPLHNYQNGQVTILQHDLSDAKLLALLGIEVTNQIHILPLRGTKQPSLDMHFPALYLYCNFIDYQYVGNERAPILRIVPITGKTGEYINIEFQKPYYLTLSTGYINTISFEIRDDTGEFVKFQSGKVTLILHFRPKRI